MNRSPQQTAAPQFSPKAPQDKKTTASIELEDKIELERREAYIEPLTRDVLRNFLQSEGRSELIPVYNPEAGYVYELPDPANEKFNSTIQKEQLLNLARLDILTKKFYESVSACPNCEGINLTMHSRCPKCKSHNIQKTGLTEHIPCGYIDQRDKYANDRCPKCGEILSEGQYRNMGRWYICQECGDKFENPEVDLICHSCNRNFLLKEAHLRDIPKFTLNPARIKEIRQNVASLEDIRRLLASLGFKIQMPGLAIGEKSGMQHHFSLIAKRMYNGKEITMALDHAVSESEVQASPLILYIYKTSEFKVDIPVFVAMPKLNDTAKKIAQGHKILVVEGSTNDEETIKCIEEEIETRTLQIAPTPTTQVEQQPAAKEKKSIFSKFGL